MIDSFRGQYSFLSNFYRHKIVHEGISYPTVEHAYQASKTHDPMWRIKIAECGKPGEAKRQGQLIDLRPDWESVKLGIMSELLGLKFADDTLRIMLLNTYPHELVEGNNWGDFYWGKVQGVGQNMLGKLLMEQREHLREVMLS